MFSTLGIVEVNGQTGFSAARRFGNHSLLEWVVRRVTETQCWDGIIVVSNAADKAAVQQHVPANIPLHASEGADSLSRLASAIRAFPTQAIIRVSLATPFVDPALIDRLIRSAQSVNNIDYASYCRGDGTPALLSRVGVFAEWCRAEAILRADQEASDPQERADATRYLYSHPELFSLRLVPLPDSLDRDDVRLGIGGEEDWEHAQAILDALGPDRLEWQRIAELLQQHPAIRQRMAVLNHSEVWM